MIGRTGQHAIRALTCLARLPEGECVGAATVARQIGAPPNYLGKLLQVLTRNGLVESRRGAGGGFRLARGPQSITLLEVMAPLDDVSRWSGCFLEPGPCSVAAHCSIHDRWAGIRDSMLEMLERTTIADLAGREQG
jgi:Rrf2 family protein